jgi:hypothetical protein
LFIILFKVKKDIPLFFSGGRGLRYLIIFFIGLPFFLFYYYIIKERKLEELKESLGYEHFDKEITHRAFLFFYFFILFAALTAVILMY